MAPQYEDRHAEPSPERARVIRLLAGRLGQAALVMLAVTAVAFALFRFVGGPVSIMSRENATPAE